MFALEPAELTRGPVLDCPGGPSSFAAIASAWGGSVTAVGPSYGPPASVLDAECATALERTVAQLAENPEPFV